MVAKGEAKEERLGYMKTRGKHGRVSKLYISKSKAISVHILYRV